MKTTRRGFLKITGAVAAAAFVGLPDIGALAEEANATTLTICNVPIGAGVRVIDEATDEVVFQGTATADSITVEHEPNCRLIISIRRREFKAFQIHAGNLPDRSVLSLYVPRDEVYT